MARGLKCPAGGGGAPGVRDSQHPPRTTNRKIIGHFSIEKLIIHQGQFHILPAVSFFLQFQRENSRNMAFVLQVPPTGNVPFETSTELSSIMLPSEIVNREFAANGIGVCWLKLKLVHLHRYSKGPDPRIVNSLRPQSGEDCCRQEVGYPIGEGARGERGNMARRSVCGCSSVWPNAPA